LLRKVDTPLLEVKKSGLLLRIEEKPFKKRFHEVKKMEFVKTEIQQQPITELNVGMVHASIWAHPTHSGKSFYTVSLKRRIRKNQSWDFINRLHQQDIRDAIFLLQHTLERIEEEEGTFFE